MEALDAPYWPLELHRAVRFRQPYRSARLGWSLKIVAAVWLGLAIWLTPRVAAKARDLKTSNDPSSAIFMLACVPTLFLLYIGQGLVQRDVVRELADDQRRPLLYLRSFFVDGTTTLQPDTWLAGYLGVSGALRGRFSVAGPRHGNWRNCSTRCGSSGCSSEQLRTPRSNRSSATFGNSVRSSPLASRASGSAQSVQREYVGDDEWQAVVMKRLRGSQAVLLQPAHSAGMEWELNAVFQNCPFERILILLTQANQCANQYEELRARLDPFVHHDLPRSIPFRGRPAFLWFEKDGTPRWTEISYRSPATWLFTGNAIDLEHTLRPFVQGIHGGERELPRPVRKYSWLHTPAPWRWPASGWWALECGSNRETRRPPPCRRG